MIIDNGATRSLMAMRRALAPDWHDGPRRRRAGRLVGTRHRTSPAPLARGLRKAARCVTFLARSPEREDLLVLKELIEAGKVAPVVDRMYPLAEIADAIRYLETGGPKGKVVITV